MSEINRYLNQLNSALLVRESCLQNELLTRVNTIDNKLDSLSAQKNPKKSTNLRTERSDVQAQINNLREEIAEIRQALISLQTSGDLPNYAQPYISQQPHLAPPFKKQRITPPFMERGHRAPYCDQFYQHHNANPYFPHSSSYPNQNLAGNPTTAFNQMFPCNADRSQPSPTVMHRADLGLPAAMLFGAAVLGTALAASAIDTEVKPKTKKTAKSKVTQTS